MTEYENAICFCASVHPLVWVQGGKVCNIHVSDSVHWLPLAVFAPHFLQIIEDGYMDKVEQFPADGYSPNIRCLERAFELWNGAGYHSYYAQPGQVWIREAGEG